jgi:protease I
MHPRRPSERERIEVRFGDERLKGAWSQLPLKHAPRRARLLRRSRPWRTAVKTQRIEENRLRGRRVAVLATDGFEYLELVVPMKALRAAGADVDVVSLHRGKIRGMNLTAPTRKINVDRTVDDVDPREYDALFIPGGFANPDFLRQSRAARVLVRAFDEAKKPIATLCHGPWLLVSAGLVRGRTLAAWPSLRDDIVNAGGTWRDEPLVRNANWVSSRGPQDLQQLVPAMLELFAQRADTLAVASALDPLAPRESSPQYDRPIGAAMAGARFLPGPTARTLAGVALMALAALFALRKRRQPVRREMPRGITNPADSDVLEDGRTLIASRTVFV